MNLCEIRLRTFTVNIPLPTSTSGRSILFHQHHVNAKSEKHVAGSPLGLPATEVRPDWIAMAKLISRYSYLPIFLSVANSAT
ncbi:hypothetical protein BH10ACI4_BH10ACI4_31010 [soil metagenome]